jgi:hypothetical protein
MGSNGQAFLNMADFLNTNVWTREFPSPGNSNLGADYVLNTDYFLHNAHFTLTVRLYLDSSTIFQDTVNTATNLAREIKHIPGTNAFAVANEANYKHMTSTVVTLICSIGC